MCVWLASSYRGSLFVLHFYGAPILSLNSALISLPKTFFYINMWSLCQRVKGNVSVIL